MSSADNPVFAEWIGPHRWGIRAIAEQIQTGRNACRIGADPSAQHAQAKRRYDHHERAGLRGYYFPLALVQRSTKNDWYIFTVYEKAKILQILLIKY